MSIANELSCDVAAAVFAAQRDAQVAPDAEQLAELVLTLHTTLRQMTCAARAQRRAQLAARPSPAHNVKTAGH